MVIATPSGSGAVSGASHDALIGAIHGNKTSGPSAIRGDITRRGRFAQPQAGGVPRRPWPVRAGCVSRGHDGPPLGFSALCALSATGTEVSRDRCVLDQVADPSILGVACN